MILKKETARFPITTKYGTKNDYPETIAIGVEYWMALDKIALKRSKEGAIKKRSLFEPELCGGEFELFQRKPLSFSKFYHRS